MAYFVVACRRRGVDRLLGMDDKPHERAAIAGRHRRAGREGGHHAARAGRAALRMRRHQGRQVRLELPRADRDAAAQGQDRRPSLCRPELGIHGRQRGGRQGRRPRPRQDPEGHPLAQARGDLAPRQGHVLGRHHDPAHQHRRRPARRRRAARSARFNSVPYATDYVFLRK